MAEQADYGVRDPVTATLTLRGDLSFTPQAFGAQPCYVIEDPARSKFFRVGVPEYTFLSLLDGRTTVAQALGLAATALGQEALSEQDALAICRWLVDCQLASTSESSLGARVSARAEEHARKRFSTLANPLAIQLPLFNPDKLLDAILPYLRWLLSPACFVLWAVVCLCGLRQAWVDSDRLAATSVVFFDPGNWFRMALAWMSLKALHELFHALACKKYGGSVVRAGLCLLVFAPVAFVDVTSSWRFRSKWSRIAVAAAGMYSELVVAAVAVLVWSYTPEGLVRRTCYNVALMASVGTLVFNGNPLMRFDGYYILSDLLGVANLYAVGRQYVSYLCQRYALGLEAAPPHVAAGRAAVCKAYGIASLAWRAMFYTTLLVTLAAMFSWAGACVGAALILGSCLPSWRSLAGSLRTVAALPRSRRRSLAAVGLGAALALGGGWLLTRPALVQAPAVIEYSPGQVVRARSPGFVREIRVRSGEHVQPGQVLAVLENAELLLAFKDVSLACDQSLAQDRIYSHNNELARQQAETARRASLEKKKGELQAQINALTIRAPVEGSVIARRLDELSGQYLEAGAEVAVIGDEGSKELLVAVPQGDVDLFSAHLGAPLDVRVSGSGADDFRAPFVRLKPRAVVSLPHPALASYLGGPLAVQLKPVSDETATTVSHTYELLTPRFFGTVSLSSEQSTALYAGQLATVTFRSNGDTVGGRLFRSVRDWIGEQCDRARAR